MLVDKSVVEGPELTWQHMPPTPAELEWLKKMEDIKQCIATAFSIPPELLGSVSDYRGGNTTEAATSRKRRKKSNRKRRKKAKVRKKKR